MKWAWLLTLTGCASIKSVRTPEAEQPIETVTVGEPLEPVLSKTSPYWVVFGGAALLWLLRDKD